MTERIGSIVEIVARGDNSESTFAYPVGETAMSSPLPGMDPFLEIEEWEDFHTTYNTVIREALSPRVEPRYVVRVERRVYFEHADGVDDGIGRADVALLLAENSGSGATPREENVVATISATECLLPIPEEKRETYLVIRARETWEVVTVLELLSPSNKHRGSDGRREYLQKREEVLRSQTHLVEIDLLRGGERLPTRTPLPSADYYAIVSRRYRRPRGEVYAWTLRDPLPTIPIPLRTEDPDVPLDLQAVFTTVYDRARYDLSLDYTKPLRPPLHEADVPWLRERLEAFRSRENE
ncbi:MAG: DUF4058 family protein [Rhodopirellula sp.]|nr:DUF4058 family protein [Rhodopirellula sp.]